MDVLTLEGLRRGAQGGGEVEVRAPTHEVPENDLGALALDEGIDVGKVPGVHRLLEVRVAETRTALQDEHARRLFRRPVQLGETPRRDRAAEPRPDDADVHPLRHYLRFPRLVRPRFSRRLYEKFR